MAACEICLTYYFGSERKGTTQYVRNTCPNEHLHAFLLKYKRINQQMQTDKENREVFYSKIDKRLKDILKRKLGVEARRRKYRFDTAKRKRRKFK